MDIEKRKKLILNLMREDMYVPMKEKELAILLQVKPEKRPVLRQVLDELLMEKSIEISKRGKYSIRSGGKSGIKSEKILGKALESEIGKKWANEDLKRSKHEKSDHDKSRQDKSEHKKSEPEKSRHEKSRHDKSGYEKSRHDKLGYENTKYNAKRSRQEDQRDKVKVIRDVIEPGMDILSIVKSFDLPYIFDEETLKQTESIARIVTEADMKGRKDLRAITTVTIDDADAKDLDDAISIKKEDANYRLAVHIADVTHYVREDSALDREARLRGTSVYLVDRVIPMLPPALSNGICSLNAGEDRLALSCIMLISPKGEVLEHEIAETVINVDKRMTYDAVKEIIEDKNPETIAEYDELNHLFFLMEELASILRKKRKKRGAIDFEFPESKILVNEKGVPYDIYPYFSNSATRIIEEFMLLANETVAEHFWQLKSPFIYRSHEDPEPEKIDELKIMLGNFGFKMGGSRAKVKNKRKTFIKSKSKERKNRAVGQLERIHPRDIQKILKQVAGTIYEATISRLTLRSMKRAEYSPDEISHFGLASPCYCHFTSPIRRYPDLQIHRIIKEQLNNQLSKVRRKHYEGLLAEVAKQSSDRERRAEETEREVDKMKKAEYMEDHLGEIYDGVISGITAWGFYVELPNTIEGLVHIRTVPDDYYIFDERTLRLVGRRSGLSYRLGQPVKVWVKAADKWSRLIDFELV